MWYKALALIHIRWWSPCSKDTHGAYENSHRLGSTHLNLSVQFSGLDTLTVPRPHSWPNRSFISWPRIRLKQLLALIVSSSLHVGRTHILAVSSILPLRCALQWMCLTSSGLVGQDICHLGKIWGSRTHLVEGVSSHVQQFMVVSPNHRTATSIKQKTFSRFESEH